MTGVLKVACIQMNAGPDIKQNLEIADGMIRQAASEGAQLIATPENTCHIRFPVGAKLESAFPQDHHPGIPLFSALSKEVDVWLLIGSMAIKSANNKLFNRSFLFSPDGELVATYDKIHLFDVELPGGETHKESDIVEVGDKAVLANTPWGGLGLSICYDVRFSYLYRDLARAGASIMAVPAAFTVPTGRAHWETLLRARAIETGSFVLAPAQTGVHENGRRTWGHSLIISPWGEVLADAGQEPGIIHATLNLGHVEKSRNAIPALRHDRDYKISKS